VVSGADALPYSRALGLPLRLPKIRSSPLTLSGSRPGSGSSSVSSIATTIRTGYVRLFDGDKRARAFRGKVHGRISTEATGAHTGGRQKPEEPQPVTGQHKCTLEQ
jgi:hypothetical protein